MKAVQVRYKVQADYAERNRANIRAVTDALAARPIDGVHYAVYELEDGQSFVHINLSRDEAALKAFTAQPEFQAFQKGLLASAPVVPPSFEDMTLVGAGFPL